MFTTAIIKIIASALLALLAASIIKNVQANLTSTLDCATNLISTTSAFTSATSNPCG